MLKFFLDPAARCIGAMVICGVAVVLIRETKAVDFQA
jgi:hypothetical protein